MAAVRVRVQDPGAVLSVHGCQGVNDVLAPPRCSQKSASAPSPPVTPSCGAQAVFSSVNRLLLDTATSEWLFCTDFFAEDGVFLDLFGPTQQLVEAGLAAQLLVQP